MRNYTIGFYGDGDAAWHEYLRRKALEDISNDTQVISRGVSSLRYEISAQTRSLIASYEDLARQNIQVIGEGFERIDSTLSEGFARIDSTLSEGFEVVSFQLDAIQKGISELSATFFWGFSQVLIQLGNVVDRLDMLIELAKTPAQTWAYNQFEIACDAVRRNLYPEALVCLDRAINGHGTEPGYKLEYRFHFLKGQLHLGSFRHTDASILSLDKAKKAFLLAARYARKDYSRDAARALLAAGWASYCLDDIKPALNFSFEALRLNPYFTEAQFQIAKFLMHNNEPKKAIPFLRKAINHDRLYSIKAAGDDDICQYQSYLDSLIRELREQERKIANTYIEKYLASLKQCEHWRIDPKKDEIAKYAFASFDRGKALYDQDSFFGYQDAKVHIEEGLKVLERAVDAERKRLYNIVSDKLSELYRPNFEALKAFKRRRKPEYFRYEDYTEDYTMIGALEKELRNLEKKLRNLEKKSSIKKVIFTMVGCVLGGGIGFLFGYITTFVAGINEVPIMWMKLASILGGMAGFIWSLIAVNKLVTRSQ